MTITKSHFTTYLDAPMHLWAKVHNKLDPKEADAYAKHLSEQGYIVEQFAEKYIRECLIPKYKATESDILIQPTQAESEFEARTDVLVKNPETKLWDMYEIKSSTRIEKTHKYDATFQYLIFRKHYELGEIYILHLNREYIRQDMIDLEKLFIPEKITEDVQKLKDEVHRLRYDALETFIQDVPENILTCIRPKTCPCIDLCHHDTPAYSIYDVNNLTANEKKIRLLEEKGIRSIYDIPSDFSLSPKQKTQVDVAKSGTIEINKEEILKRLNKLKFPLYFIDYESFNPAIPMYRGYKPYDQIPFQWSLHIQRSENSELEHYDFIETEMIDPVPNFLEALMRLMGEDGSIIVWNESFEGTQNKRMGEIHPKYKAFCQNMNERMFDLMKIFRDCLYSDPNFKGSYSIKKILPVLVPDLSYNALEIAEGATAMASWNEMVNKPCENQKKQKFKADLLKYCEMDTLAMVRIYEKLLKS